MTDSMTNPDNLIAHARELRNACLHSLPNGVGNTIDALCDALETAYARIEKLEGALRPFADALDDDDEDEADHVQGTLVIGRSTIYSLDLGDFRQARAALGDAPTSDEVTVTDAMIEAGIAARERLMADMQARERSDHPEDLPDYDEGDVMTHIYRAMSAARLEARNE